MISLKYSCEHKDMSVFAQGQILSNLIIASEYKKIRYAEAFNEYYLKKNRFDKIPKPSAARGPSVDYATNNYKYLNVNSPRVLIGEKNGAIQNFAKFKCIFWIMTISAVVLLITIISLNFLTDSLLWR